ncbi:phage antirepressor KilAC domain-containing protein [Halomonas organivorans]
MKRYSLQQAAALLGTGRTTLCRDLREMGMLDANNLGTRPHTAAGRLIVELRTYEHIGMGQPKPYGKTFITERGLMYIATRLGRDVVTHREAANDAQA